MVDIEPLLNRVLSALRQRATAPVEVHLETVEQAAALRTPLDILRVGQHYEVDALLAHCDLSTIAAAIIRLNWRHMPVRDRFRVIRRLERHGYTVGLLGDELIALGQIPPTDANDIVLYLITYNAPGQLSLWLDSVEAAAPELLDLPRKYLLDNSTDPGTQAAYDALCAPYGFTILRHGNLGISGGRFFCAQHFDQLADAFGMIWFEDDMQLAAPERPQCRNGFSTQVRQLLARARAIVEQEQLDYLKLSFTEFFGDHHLNWAWYNVDEDTRQQAFPDGTFRTRIAHTGVVDGLSYAVGDMHYSNWPTLMTRRGNALLFLDRDHARHEQRYMARAFSLLRSGEFRAGVLLASPIWHDRSFHYTPEERREY